MSVDSQIPSNQTPPLPPRRRLKRNLTTFLCQEMLFEYATDRLDAERSADVANFLPSDKSCQDTLEAIRRGLDYSSCLSRTTVAPELVARLRESESIFSLVRRFMEWEEWPETLRWSVSAIAISLLLAGIVSVVPWQRLTIHSQKEKNTIVLADIPNSAVPAKSSADSTEVAEGETQEQAAENGAEDLGTSGDEHDDGTSVPPPVAAGAPNVAPEAAPPRAADKELPSPGETGQTAALTPPTPAKEQKPRGFVYRAFINLANVDESTPQIVQSLVDLGAEKAGEVPLGWRRGAGSYFHFTAPESNENQVLELLRSYGPVRISKDPHPRVMPAGQIRFILWVEPLAESAPSN